jgi:magnesium-transporting ATPase (P-type)
MSGASSASRKIRPQGAIPWHARPAETAIDALATRPDGLTREEATERLATHGPNRLPPPQGRGPLLRLLAQFHNVLIYVLLGAGVVTAALQHWIDAAVIFGVVVINALIGFVQEGKAERALDAIRDMLSPSATLMRDGRRVVLPAEEIVPGDGVLLQSGDKVPADLRLIWTKGLQIEEAVLTGESLPVEKGTAPVSEDAALGDRASMAYSGTLVTRGQASGIAVATGDRTEIGHISALLGRVEVLTTPLLRQMAVFSRRLTVAILLLAVVTFVFGSALRDYDAAEMFLAGVALAVAAIPEGLPAIMTITLAIGVQRMARRNAIIRRLPAVETLGSVSLICSDKTGTLTRNEMTVRSIATCHHLFAVSGIGYAPTGDFLLDGAPVALEDHPLLRTMARGAFLCSDAVVREADGAWTVEGDPTEGALVTVAMKAGIDPDFESKAWPRTDVIPFESEHRFMATLHHDHEGNAVMHVKGAPERILEMCDRQRTRTGDEPLDLPYWQARVAEISASGQRVLALAARRMHSDRRELRFDDVGQGLTMIGLFGLLDPARQEAIEAVARCQAAGIRVKMITGDHGETARAVAAQLGLVNAAEVLTGRQIDALDDAALRARAAAIDVFARTSPEHKLRLVQSLQADGQVVAMTGDGVNDAPALKRADVGVAMGMKGTEAAKEAAEMVLADDNFATIAHAVEEGRTVYDDLKKAITFILPTNGGEGLIIVAAVLLGSTLPLTPVQILWVNMVTAVTLALALAFEPAESDVMRRAPRQPSEPILSGFLIWRVAFVSAILLVATFGLFVWERSQGAEVELARTVAVNVLVIVEVAYLLNTRHLRDPVINRAGLLGSRPVLISIAIVIALQLLFTYAPPMQVLFDTRPAPVSSWGLILLVATAALILVEVEKWIGRSRSRRAFDAKATVHQS